MAVKMCDRITPKRSYFVRILVMNVRVTDVRENECLGVVTGVSHTGRLDIGVLGFYLFFKVLVHLFLTSQSHNNSRVSQS